MKQLVVGVAVALTAFVAGYVVGSRQAPPSSPSDTGAADPEVAVREGVVLTADNAADVHVIDLGSEDGVAPGYYFVVSRENHYVSQIQVDRVEPKRAVGSTVRGLSTSEVRQGDTVTLRARAR